MSIYEQDLFNAILKEDLAGCVLAQLNIIRKVGPLELLIKNVKDENTSDMFRRKGNAAFGCGDYRNALILYNTALLYAPKHSHPMKLAYGNRSALWLKVKCFTSCIKDVNICLSMGCPSELHDKLARRKEEASSNIWLENFAMNASFPINFKEFFKLQTPHADIPNASSNIKIIIEPEGRKIVATRDIEVGTVLALETPFVSCLDIQNSYFTCYYCHKMSCNLIPCDGCCIALFCDESCMKKSIDEDHGVLCSIIDILVKFEFHCILATKAVIKLRQGSKCWKTFLSVASRIYESAPKNYISNIFKENLLWIKSDEENKHFTTGKMFAYSHSIAIIIHYLDIQTQFFPCEAKGDTIHAVSKLLMFISLHACSTLLSQLVYNRLSGNELYSNLPNHGLYSFMGTLKQSCLPNLKTKSTSGRDVVLISVMPIKEGSELTISHIEYWLEEINKKYMRSRRLYLLNDKICSCFICSCEWMTKKQALTEAQAKIYHKFNVYINRLKPVSPNNLPYVFKKSCQTLQKLSDATYSAEYSSVFSHFSKCLYGITDGDVCNVMF